VFFGGEGGRKNMATNNLSPELVKYLTDVGIAVEDYIRSSPVDKSVIFNNFRSLPPAPAGNYFKSFEFIEPFPSHFPDLYFR
jgi:hypothetical protein